MKHWRINELVDQLREVGVKPGGVLLVHTSFRRVHPTESGPLGLIQALREALGRDGTLIMPTMSDGMTVFDPRSTPSFEMGATAELFWRQPGVVRSTHPGGSFAAAGPHAERICAPQPLVPPHGRDSPAGRLLELDGQVLLLGVDHSESTLLHVAEDMAGVPYGVEHPCVVEVNGEPVRVMVRETDHCCRGFCRMNSWLVAGRFQREGRVGNAQAKLSRATDVIAVAVSRLAKDPLVFLCPQANGCEECDLARASIRVVEGSMTVASTARREP